MSTKPGGKSWAAGAVGQSKALIEQAAREEAEEQLSLLDPLTAEELADAQESLGPDAKPLTVLREARARRRGRPKNALNRRTDDFKRYISQFGPDPAVVLTKIMADSEEVMVERSAAMDTAKRRLTWGEARAMRIRAAETLMPYHHGKMPVKMDMTFSGVSDLFIEGVTHTSEEMADILDADFAPLDDDDIDGEREL